MVRLIRLDYKSVENSWMGCLTWNQVGEANKTVLKCKRNSCGRYYHLACLENDSRVSWPDNNPGGKSFLCPQHTCRVCKEPAPPVRNWKNVDPSKVFLQCIYCPNASHKLCIEAESSNKVLTNKSMVCDAHFVDVDGNITVSLEGERAQTVIVIFGRQIEEMNSLLLLNG